MSEILHININRLYTHFNEVLTEIADKNYDILALSKKFLVPNFWTYMFNIPGYKFIYHDREIKDGVDVSFYCRK